MALLRHDKGLDVAFQRAGRALGRLDAAFVEKDYWVTQILRSLASQYPSGFVLKGGTSLSKGYGIIERFSEDLDILVFPPTDSSIKEKEQHLEMITASVVADLGDLRWKEARDPGRGHDAHRADLISYSARIPSTIRAGIEPDAVLLETGYAGGSTPTELAEIVPLVCEAGIVSADDYDDTKPFQVAVLKPARTLIEKLFALHNLASRRLEHGAAPEERLGRHYYDIHRLLEHKPTINAIKRRNDFHALVAEVQTVSQHQFGGTYDRPAEGFAASPAFNGEPGNEIYDWLHDLYADVRGLLPHERIKLPSFDVVLERIQSDADAL